MDDYDDTCKYAVFDDISGGFKMFPHYKGWLGQQQQFTVTDKYKHKQTIRWGRPTIWISNNDPTEDQHVDYEWLQGNCIIVYIGTPLY